MEEFVINEAKIKENLEYLDNVNGLTKDDKKMARCDLIAGIDRLLLRKYYKRNVSQTRKKIISFLLRAGAPESVIDKYLDKKIKEEKISQAVRYITEGVPAQYVDLHFNDSLFPRLSEYWLYEQNLLKIKKEKEEAENKKTPDGLIRTEETEAPVEDKSDEIEETVVNEKEDESTKDESDDDSKAEVIAGETVTEVEAEEKNDSKSDEGIKPEAAVSQNTVINGFTFEQMMELFSYMNSNANSNVQKMYDATPAEVEKPVSEDKIQAIVAAAMKQTIEEAKKQTLEEISKQRTTDVDIAVKTESKLSDINIDDIRKEISELRREADENKKTENALRNELEEKSKETAERMKDYYEMFRNLKTNPEEDKVEASEEQNSKLSTSGYMVPLKDSNGNIVGTMPVEIERRKSNGLGGLFGLLGFKKKSQQSLVRMVISGELNKAQLSHIVGAMKKGLSEGQLTDLIESKVPAEKMPEIIEIALLEKSMGYAY
ncbi:MAG: hypothetical protein IJ065_09820 [Eubacterium sp.]|nr:hypothetical protein [Eubacterium sp.]